MNKIEELNKLIEAVLKNKPISDPLVTEELTTDKVIPAVPFPKLQLNDGWGKDPKGGLDVSLFKLAGLGQQGTIGERLAHLFELVRCDEQTCPSGVREIIARLSVMEMFSSMMNQYNASSKGFLFENFMALVLKGATVGGTVIQDVEIMTGEESAVSKNVSLKLLKQSGPIKGSITNLHRAVIELGQPVTYIIGYKLKDGSKVEIKYFTIDERFFNNINIGGGNTMQSIYVNREETPQFYINSRMVHNLSRDNIVGNVPIFTTEQLKDKAEILTAALNAPVYKIYENLNLFSQLLTKLYIENDHDAGASASQAFEQLRIAVEQDENIK